MQKCKYLLISKKIINTPPTELQQVVQVTAFRNVGAEVSVVLVEQSDQSKLYGTFSPSSSRGLK